MNRAARYRRWSRGLSGGLVGLLFTFQGLTAQTEPGVTPASNAAPPASGGLTRESLDAPRPSAPPARRTQTRRRRARHRSRRRHARHRRHRTRAAHAPVRQETPPRHGFLHRFKHWWHTHFSSPTPNRPRAGERRR